MPFCNRHFWSAHDELAERLSSTSTRSERPDAAFQPQQPRAEASVTFVSGLWFARIDAHRWRLLLPRLILVPHPHGGQCRRGFSVVAILHT